MTNTKTKALAPVSARTVARRKWLASLVAGSHAVLYRNGKAWRIVRVTGIGATFDTSPIRIRLFCPLADATDATDATPQSVLWKTGMTIYGGARWSIEPISPDAAGAVIVTLVSKALEDANHDIIECGKPKSFHADRIVQAALALGGFTRRSLNVEAFRGE